MEQFLIERIAEKAMKSNRKVRIELKDIEAGKDAFIEGKVDQIGPYSLVISNNPYWQICRYELIKWIETL